MFENFLQGIKDIFEYMEEKRKNIAQISKTLGEVELFTKNADAKINEQLSRNSTSLGEINVSISKNITDLTTLLKNADRKNSELSAANAGLSSELQKVSSESNGKSSEISQLRGDIKSKDAKISELASNLKKYTDGYTALKENFDKKEKSLQDYQEKNSSLSEYKTRTETALSPFIEILKYCYECDALKEVIKDNGLSPEFSEADYKNIFTFIALFGKETTFALIVQSAIKKVKSADHSPLSEKEKRLIKSLNSYYKATFGYKFDVLDMLDGETKFDRTLMRDIKDQANPDPSIKTVKCVCVPVYRKGPSDSVETKGYIVGE